MSNVKSCFCLLNCFNNYEIVASKIIQFYIENATNALSSNVNVSQFYEVTPYVIYTWLIPATVPPPSSTSVTRVKQFSDFILILALTSVTLARINNADATVFGAQGVVTNPGFSVMYTVANELNKVTAYWTDDLRNLWGTSDDPLFIGMAPLPYKYLWLSNNDPNQDEKFNVQPKGLNGPDVIPSLASSENLCPIADKKKFEGRWNTFIDLLNRGSDVKAHNSPGISSRTQNLIKLGNAIIQYVETGKDTKTWGPGGWDPTINTILYWDMESVINSNKDLLFPQEQLFITQNIKQQQQSLHSMKMNGMTPQLSTQSLHRFKNQPLINPSKTHSHELARALGEGISKMMKQG